MSFARVVVSLAALFMSLSAAALQLPAGVSAEATGPAGAVVHFSAHGSGPDDFNGRPTDQAQCTPASGSLFAIGTTTVACSDANGATGTFDVTVQDTTGPALHLPNGVAATTTSNVAAVSWSASATDVVDGSVSVTCTPVSGSFFAIGTTEVTCAASDARNNRSEGKFTVTVASAGPPPDDITREATGPGGAIVTFPNTGSDGDDFNGRPTSGCTPASGSQFPLGSTLVQCGGGVAFTVTVVDTTAPAITVPADMTVSDGTTVTYDATAHDLVDGDVAVACAPPSGAAFPAGTTVVTCSASDSRNNGATATFTVTVTDDPPPPDDTEAPVIVSIAASPSVILPPNGKLVDVTLDVHVTDNLDPAPVVRIFDVTSNETLDPDDTNQVSALTVQLRAERDPHGTGRVYTIHVEAIDAAGNRGTASVQVTVPHDSSGQSTTLPAPKKQRSVRR